jgi:hypothetical protein
MIELSVGASERNTMENFETLKELESFELRWKIVFTCFALVLAGALLDHLLRAPHGKEAIWCYSAGVIAFLGALWSAHKLRDGARMEGVLGSLDLLSEDLSIGDWDD